MLSNVTTRVVATVASAIILALLVVVWREAEKASDAIRELPDGAIVAFDLPAGCPKDEGWHPFSDAEGKAIIGADKENFAYRAEKGALHIAVTKNHLPVHVHEYDDIYYSSDVGRPDGTKAIEVPKRRGLAAPNDDNNVGWAITRETNLPSLRDEPLELNNMQPSIPLHFCIRRT